MPSADAEELLRATQADPNTIDEFFAASEFASLFRGDDASCRPVSQVTVMSCIGKTDKDGRINISNFYRTLSLGTNKKDAFDSIQYLARLLCIIL